MRLKLKKHDFENIPELEVDEAVQEALQNVQLQSYKEFFLKAIFIKYLKCWAENLFRPAHESWKLRKYKHPSKVKNHIILIKLN